MKFWYVNGHTVDADGKPLETKTYDVALSGEIEDVPPAFRAQYPGVVITQVSFKGEAVELSQAIIKEIASRKVTP